jgi:hypothetical protein
MDIIAPAMFWRVIVEDYSIRAAESKLRNALDSMLSAILWVTISAR